LPHFVTSTTPAHPAMAVPTSCADEQPVHSMTPPPAVAVESSSAPKRRQRVKYTEPPLQLTSSTPAMAVTPRPATLPQFSSITPAMAVSPSPATPPLSPVDSEAGGVKLPTPPRPASPALAAPPQSLPPSNMTAREFDLLFDRTVARYRAFRFESQHSNEPLAVVNPEVPGCRHFNKWEKCFDVGSRCGGPDCGRMIGSNAHFLMQCVNCGLCACYQHQRKATSHSTMHAWGVNKEYSRKTGL
jgi:hypothetical protein